MSIDLMRAEVVGFLGDVPAHLAYRKPLYCSDEGYCIENGNGDIEPVSRDFKANCARILVPQPTGGCEAAVVAMSVETEAYLNKAFPSYVQRYLKTVVPVRKRTKDGAQEGRAIVMPRISLVVYFDIFWKELRSEIDGLIASEGEEETNRLALKLASIGIGCCLRDDVDRRRKMFVRLLAATSLLLDLSEEADKKIFANHVRNIASVFKEETEERLSEYALKYIKGVRRESHRPSVPVE